MERLHSPVPFHDDVVQKPCRFRHRLRRYPVLIDEKGEIIAGHGRVMAAEMLKMDSVPVIVLAGDTTYREWFLRQPYTRQKQIVGETRAKLIRDGGMSPDEFYTDKGEWLTLKQLRERDAQVFRKAGI